MFNWRAIEVDALLALQRFAEAGIAIDEFENAIPESGLASATTAIARCRGNLAAATGDASRAESEFVKAHSMEAQVLMPFEIAMVCFSDGKRLRGVENFLALSRNLNEHINFLRPWRRSVRYYVRFRTGRFAHRGGAK